VKKDLWEHGSVMELGSELFCGGEKRKRAAGEGNMMNSREKKELEREANVTVEKKGGS